MASEPKYDRSRMGSYIQTREAMITTKMKSKCPKPQIPEPKPEPELKFVKLPPSKDKLFCIYLEKFETIVHSFITEFLESQLFRISRESVPNNYNLKMKIKLMNYILLKFDCRSRKLLQEEVLSTLCHLICHQRKLLKSESYRSCDLNNCNASDLIWALKQDHTRHLEELLRRLKSEYKEKAEAYDPESVRAQQAYVEESLVPIYSLQDRPSSPRVKPDMHYKNVIEQIFRKKACKCGHENPDVYAVRKDTEFPPHPYDRASLLIGKTKSRKVLTSYSRDQLLSTTNVTNNNKSPEIGSGPAGDCAYTYTGLFGIRSPEERKLLECKVAVHLRALGQKCPFKVRPCSAATNSYRRMIVNEITTLQTFEDSLLNYSLLSNCVPLLWCGTGPDGKPLLYPTEYNASDCSTRIGPSGNNLALSHRLFHKGSECEGARARAEARKKRKGRSYASDSSGSSHRERGRHRKDKDGGGKIRKSYSATSLSTTPSARSASPKSKRPNTKQQYGRNRQHNKNRGRPKQVQSEKHLVNKTTSTLQAMLALEFERNKGRLSTEAHAIQTELEYRKMMDRGEMPIPAESDEESKSSHTGKERKKTPKTSFGSSVGSKRLSGRKSRPSIRRSQYSMTGSTRSCGTLCDLAAQTRNASVSPKRSRSNVKDKATGGGEKYPYYYGVKDKYFSQNNSRYGSRTEWSEENKRDGKRRSKDKNDKNDKRRSNGSSSNKASQTEPRGSINRNNQTGFRRSQGKLSRQDVKAGPSARNSRMDFTRASTMRNSVPDAGHGPRPTKVQPRYSRTDYKNNSARNSRLEPTRGRYSRTDVKREDDRGRYASPQRTPQTSPTRAAQLRKLVEAVIEKQSQASQYTRERQSNEAVETSGEFRSSTGAQVKPERQSFGMQARKSRASVETQARGSKGSNGTQTQRRSGQASGTQANGPGRSSLGTQDDSSKKKTSLGTQAETKTRNSTFGVQTSKGSFSQGVQTKADKKAEEDGDTQTDEDRVNEGDQWEVVDRLKLSQDRGTSGTALSRPVSTGVGEIYSEEEDTVPVTNTKQQRGRGKLSNTGTDPIPSNTRDANVGERRGSKIIPSQRTTKDKGINVGKGGGGSRNASKEAEARVSDEEDRKSNSSERRWKHATFSRTLIKGPATFARHKSFSATTNRIPAHGKNGSKIKFAPKLSTGFIASVESRTRLQQRKKTGFAKGQVGHAQAKLDALYEAATSKGAKRSDEEPVSASVQHRGSRAESLRHAARLTSGGVRAAASAASRRLPKLTSDKGLNTEQAGKKDKFFDSFKGRTVAPDTKSKIANRKLPQATESYTGVAHWKNVERVAEYSKSLRVISKAKPLPWNARPDGWDEFGKGRVPRPIGFGDDVNRVINTSLGFPGVRNDGSGVGGGTCQSEGLAERRPSKVLTSDRDEIIDLTIPQENFFWVPLGRYSWEVRNIKVWKSQFVPAREKLGSKEYMGIFPDIKLPAKESDTCIDTSDTQSDAKRFVSCPDICSVCLLASGYCQCD